MTPDPATLEAVIAEVLAVHRQRGLTDYCYCGERAPNNSTVEHVAHVAAVLADRLTAPGERPCPECDGGGMKTRSFAETPVGQTNLTQCPSCHGTGVVSSDVPAIIEAVMEPVGWHCAPVSTWSGYVLNIEPVEGPNEMPVYRLRRDPGATP